MKNNQKTEYLGTGFFGINLSCFSKKQLISLVNEALKDSKNSLLIATINPEILLKAEKSKAYKKILNSFNLRIVDGFGIKLVGFIKRVKTGERVAGADLATYILNQVKIMGLRAGFIMKQGGLSSKEDLNFKIQSLGIRNYEIIYEKENLEMIRNSEVLFVGLGAPEQEKFIWQSKDMLPNLKVAMGIGGTFDFWTGRQKRAPLFLRKIGLEWLWRLIIQPKRIIRIWKVIAVFLWKSLFFNKTK